MRQSTFDTTSVQRGIEHAEEPGVTPQGEDGALDLKRRLDSFSRTHPYKEIQVEGQRWRYVVGGQGERTLLLLITLLNGTAGVIFGTWATYMVYVAIALAPWLAFLTVRPRVHRQETVP